MRKNFYLGLALALVFILLGANFVMAQEEVDLSFMHFQTGESQDADDVAFHMMYDQYQEENPEVDLDTELLDIDSYYMKIKTLAAANELPDIFPIRSSMINTFLDNGLIIDWSQELEKGGWGDGFIDGAFTDFRQDGGIYGIPWSMGATSLIYYNQEIFNEVGIEEFPRKWEDLITAIEKLNEAGYTPIALGNKGKWVANSCILSALADRYTGTEWFHNILERNGAAFTDPEFVSSLAALEELAAVGAFNPDMNSIDANQQKSLYYNKDAAMFIEGHWAINSIMEQAPEDIIENTMIDIIPAVPEGKGEQRATSSGSGMGYQIHPDLEGAEKEAAVEFVKTVTGEEYSTHLIERNGTPVYKTSDYDTSKISRLKNDYMELTNNVKFTPVYDLHLQPSLIEVMNTGMQELLIQVITPEELAARIQAEYESLE